MAIKISNTTVINDSRGLENITNLKTINSQSILGTGDIASGAIGDVFWVNGQTVTSNYTIAVGKNAGTFGPVTINSGITVTVSSGSRWIIV